MTGNGLESSLHNKEEPSSSSPKKHSTVKNEKIHEDNFSTSDNTIMNNDIKTKDDIKSSPVVTDDANNSEIEVGDQENVTIIELDATDEIKVEDRKSTIHNLVKNDDFDYRNETLSPSSSNYFYSQSSYAGSQTMDEDVSSSNYHHLKERLSLPLSEAIRPSSLEEYIGQSHLMGEDIGSIKQFFRLGYIPSMVLYGPPGVGKTTIASILAKETGYVFIELSATESTVSDMRDLQKIITTENRLREKREEDSLRVVVFIDEIHRFSKTQQDFLLPFVESGDFVFIGATTSNPKARIRRALLSRCQLYELTSLSQEETQQVLKRAILYENIRRRIFHQMKFLDYDSDCLRLIIKRCYGDTRQAINLIELISTHYMTENLKYNINDENPYNLNYNDLKDAIKIVRLNESGLQYKKNIRLYLELFKYMHNPDYTTIETNEVYISNDTDTDDDTNTERKLQNVSNTINLNPEIELWVDNMDNVNLFAEEFSKKKNMVTIDRSIEGKLIVTLPLSKNIVKSENSKEELIFLSDESESESENDYLNFQEYFKTRRFNAESLENKYLRQMQVSDDEDENEKEDNIFKDEEGVPYNFYNISYSNYNASAAVYCLLKLLRAGESSIYILKQLVLFAVLYLDSGLLEPAKTLSTLKSIKKSDTDILKVLSTCIERLTKSEKLKITPNNDPVRHLRCLREFWKTQVSTLETSKKAMVPKVPHFEVTYMSEAEYESMMSYSLSERGSSKEFPDISVQNIDEVDLDDMELSVIVRSISDDVDSNS